MGSSFVDVLDLFQNDPDTDAVVMIGEIGGAKEQEAAAYIQDHFTKPVVSLIVGTTAPAGKRMGHAGAIITGASARAEDKVKALQDAGARIAPSPARLASPCRPPSGCRLRGAAIGAIRGEQWLGVTMDTLRRVLV